MLIDACERVDESVIDAEVCRKLLKVISNEDDNMLFEEF